jgi:hypothetical protein
MSVVKLMDPGFTGKNTNNGVPDVSSRVYTLVKTVYL